MKQACSYISHKSNEKKQNAPRFLVLYAYASTFLNDTRELARKEAMERERDALTINVWRTPLEGWGCGRNETTGWMCTPTIGRCLNFF